MTKYDAMAFLEGLFRHPSGEVSGGASLGEHNAPDVTPADLPLEWHFLWDERAAIMEYDGRLPRERAEAEALKEILGKMRQRALQ